MVVDSIRDSCIRALRTCVKAADHSLQFRELFYKLRREICLGQQRSLIHRFSIRSSTARVSRCDQLRCNGSNPLLFLPVAAEVLLESDVVQQCRALAQRNTLIELPEETCIVEASAQNTLIPLPDSRLIFGAELNIEHGEEVRRQLAQAVIHRKVLLVITHDRDKDFFRQIQIFRREVPQQDIRPLCQVGNGVN